MYTSGIRKIFTSQNARNLIELKHQAKECGYSAINFNGKIYVLGNNNKWVETEFYISDFTV